MNSNYETPLSVRAKIFVTDKIQLLNEYNQTLLNWYKLQPKWKQILIGILGIIGLIIFSIVLIFHKYLIHGLVILSDHWNDLKFGKLILFILVFMVGFPPIIGFSALSMLTGMVYGFPNGWPLLASASISGSFVSFIFYRYLLHNQAEALIKSNEKFRAFSEILREDSSLFLLILIRLCPLPYSLSNGALAAIPELSSITYLLASILTSPKLFIHIFVGYKLKELGDDTKSRTTKIFDLISIIITAIASALTTYIIYYKMQQKLTTYHSRNDNTNSNGYDEMIFGNFEDDLESGNNVELNSTDFDEDNFIIDDDENDNDNNNDESSITSANNKANKSNKTNNIDDNEFEINDDFDGLGIDDFNKLSRGYRDH